MTNLSLLHLDVEKIFSFARNFAKKGEQNVHRSVYEYSVYAYHGFKFGFAVFQTVSYTSSDTYPTCSKQAKIEENILRLL